MKTFADQFNHFFINKIKNIRDKIVPHEDLLEDKQRHTEAVLTRFLPLSDADIILMVAHSNKYCHLDPIPSALLKLHLDVLLPLLSEIINCSLTEGSFPNSLKHASVTPIYKGKNLNKMT